MHKKIMHGFLLGTGQIIIHTDMDPRSIELRQDLIVPCCILDFEFGDEHRTDCVQLL